MIQDQVQPLIDGLQAGENRVHIGIPTTDLARSSSTAHCWGPSRASGADYAKFEPRAPRLNLTLIELPQWSDLSDAQCEPAAATRHFGLQVDSTAAVARSAGRLRATGITGHSEGETSCCYAVQDMTWFTDPAGNAWEVYVVLANGG